MLTTASSDRLSGSLPDPSGWCCVPFELQMHSLLFCCTGMRVSLIAIELRIWISILFQILF